MEFEWQTKFVNNGAVEYRVLKGYVDCCVRVTQLLTKKYLWQYKKYVGYSDSVQDAIDEVEALVEYYSQPAKMRGKVF